MYIRRTQTRNTATGERYHTHRLVRSERVGGKVRQMTLLNLGRHFAVPQADWPTLCARLQEMLSGQEVLLAGYGGLVVERSAASGGAVAGASSQRRRRRRPAPSPRTRCTRMRPTR